MKIGLFYSQLDSSKGKNGNANMLKPINNVDAPMLPALFSTMEAAVSVAKVYARQNNTHVFLCPVVTPNE